MRGKRAKKRPVSDETGRFFAGFRIQDSGVRHRLQVHSIAQAASPFDDFFCYVILSAAKNLKKVRFPGF